MPELSVITCTSDRPQAFALCKRWMRRQTMPQERIEWICVDDGEHVADVQWPAWHLPLPPQSAAKESFRQNMLAGLVACTGDKIAILEDDDWYHPDYLSLMSALLDIREIVGCARARYYNLRHRLWRVHPNTAHASLSTTAFSRSLLPTAIKILKDCNFTRPENPEQLDGTLWKRSGIPDMLKLLLPESPHVVSIKGMPGKAGLGIDHSRAEILSGRSSGGRRVYKHDQTGDKLREWIGDDARFYERFAQPTEAA